MFQLATNKSQNFGGLARKIKNFQGRMALVLLAITTTEFLGSNPTVSKIFFVFVNCIKEMKIRSQKWPKFFFMKLFIFLLTLVEKKLKLKLERNRMKKWEWEISFQWTINFSSTTTALTLTEQDRR